VSVHTPFSARADVWLYGLIGIVNHMKTTVNLPDELLRQAQELARRDGTTVKELIETGLRTVVKQRSGEYCFQLADAGVDGRGLRPEFRGARWEHIRDTIYGPPE
jgi:Bacterial antitoxin of type II TA system, VapB